MFESSSYGLTTLHRHFTAVFSREFLSVFAKLKQKEKNVVVYIINFYFRWYRATKKGYLQSDLISAKQIVAKVCFIQKRTQKLLNLTNFHIRNKLK